jgi:uncharacterized protein YoxC
MFTDVGAVELFTILLLISLTVLAVLASIFVYRATLLLKEFAPLAKDLQQKMAQVNPLFTAAENFGEGLACRASLYKEEQQHSSAKVAFIRDEQNALAVNVLELLLQAIAIWRKRRSP